MHLGLDWRRLPDVDHQGHNSDDQDFGQIGGSECRQAVLVDSQEVNTKEFVAHKDVEEEFKTVGNTLQRVLDGDYVVFLHVHEEVSLLDDADGEDSEKRRHPEDGGGEVYEARGGDDRPDLAKVSNCPAPTPDGESREQPDQDSAHNPNGGIVDGFEGEQYVGLKRHLHGLLQVGKSDAGTEHVHCHSVTNDETTEEEIKIVHWRLLQEGEDAERLNDVGDANEGDHLGVGHVKLEPPEEEVLSDDTGESDVDHFSSNAVGEDVGELIEEGFVIQLVTSEEQNRNPDFRLRFQIIFLKDLLKVFPPTT